MEIRSIAGRECLIDKHEAAALLKMSVSLIEKLSTLPAVNPKRLPSHKLPTGSRRYLPSELLNWATGKEGAA